MADSDTKITYVSHFYFWSSWLGFRFVRWVFGFLETNCNEMVVLPPRNFRFFLLQNTSHHLYVQYNHSFDIQWSPTSAWLAAITTRIFSLTRHFVHYTEWLSTTRPSTRITNVILVAANVHHYLESRKWCDRKQLFALTLVRHSHHNMSSHLLVKANEYKRPW